MQVRDSSGMVNSPLVVVHVALECILGLLPLQALLIIVPLFLAHLISASATQASRPTAFWIRAFERAAHCTGTMCARQGVHAESCGPKNQRGVIGRKEERGRTYCNCRSRQCAHHAQPRTPGTASRTQICMRTTELSPSFRAQFWKYASHSAARPSFTKPVSF